MGAQKVICVTGGNGLIGKPLVARLLSKGYRVRVLTRKSNGECSGAEIFTGDLCDRQSLSRFLAGADCLFHCAAELAASSRMWAVNVEGTRNIIDACKPIGLEYFCFISSAGVVGRTLERRIDEEVECRPVNLYERSKCAAERLVRDAGLGARVVILRPTNVVSHELPGAVLPGIRKKLIDRLKVFFKGAEVAHVVHAEDVASAAVYLMKATDHTPQCYFVSCDNEKLNTFSGLWELATRLRTPQKNSRKPLCLPLIFPYLFRLLFRGGGNMGDVRYVPDKLLGTGFRFEYDVAKIVASVSTGADNDVALRKKG